MKRKLLLNIFIFATMIAINSCEVSNNPALGKDDEIIVVADSITYDSIKVLLADVFEKEVFTPQPEKLFKIKKISLKEIETYKTSKNILITADLSSKEQVALFLQAFLTTGKDTLNINLDNTRFVSKGNLWGKDQMVVFIAAENVAGLKEKIQTNENELLGVYQSAGEERIKDQVFGELKTSNQVADEYFDKYGWKINLPTDYKLIKEIPGRFAAFIKNYNGNEKLVYISWHDNVEMKELNSDSLIFLRNSAVKNLSDIKKSLNMNTAGSACSVNEYLFKGNYGYVLQGIWNSKDINNGGPFISYIFYDETNKRLFQIEALIHTSHSQKSSSIREMDVLLNTFALRK